MNWTPLHSQKKHNRLQITRWNSCLATGQLDGSQNSCVQGPDYQEMFAPVHALSAMRILTNLTKIQNREKSARIEYKDLDQSMEINCGRSGIWCFNCMFVWRYVLRRQLGSILSQLRLHRFSLFRVHAQDERDNYKASRVSNMSVCIHFYDDVLPWPLRWNSAIIK